MNRSESTAQGHQEVEINGEREKATQEWPRIYIALSRKEKEEDFLVMKGTKLPHRPRKRAKNIDKALQFCFPGMWLSDLTKNRYEVREKKKCEEAETERIERHGEYGHRLRVNFLFLVSFSFCMVYDFSFEENKYEDARVACL